VWTPTLVLIATTALFSGILLGGGLYEHLAIDPFWPKRPGIVQQRNGGISRRRFWLPAHVAFEVLLVASVIAAWGRPETRYPLLVALATHAGARVWSLLDVIPKAAEFERTDPADVDEAVAVRWTRRSLLRLPLNLVTSGAIFFALMFGSHA
jgi:hypothetical protein